MIVRKLVGVLLALTLVGGCGYPPRTPPPPDAAAALESLAMVPRPSTDHRYRRAHFGTAWHDTDRNGCNQRDDVLMRDLQRGELWTVVQQGRCDHDVVAGTWIDAYTSEQLTFTNLKDGAQASAIPIDHVVALASAWRYGASGWTADRRLEFANDLDNLQPTSRSVNSAKGAKTRQLGGPSEHSNARMPLATSESRPSTTCRSTSPRSLRCRT